MYREHRRLSPALRPLVACVWTLRTPAASAGRLHRVLPDGCMDVLFSLGSGPREETAAGPRPARYVVGTMTAPLEVRHAGALDIVGVRFRPGATPAFVDLPADQVTDGIAPLDDVWGSLAAETFGRLGERPDTAGRVATVEAALLRALGAGEARHDPAVLAACRILAARPGRTRVDEVAQVVGVGRRQLERRFRAAVGLSPGGVARVQRFRRAVRAMKRSPGSSLARVALEAGYYDQPHLTREFRALAGETPGRWRAAGGGGTGAPSSPEAAGADDASIQDAGPRER